MYYNCQKQLYSGKIIRYPSHFKYCSLYYCKPTVEQNYIPLEAQSQAKTQVTPSEPEGSKGKGKRHSEGLITAKEWTPISTQRNRKPQNSESIQGKPPLTTCTGKITIINAVVTSKGKLPKSVDRKFVQKTSQRTKKACPEPEDPEEDTLDTVVDGKKLREIIPTLQFTFQSNRNLGAKDWKDMDQVLQLDQLLKDLFQWSMGNKRLKLPSYWEELGASFQKIYCKETDFKDLMVITKGWNHNRQFRLLEERETRIRQNYATIQAIEGKLTQTGHIKIASGSQGVGQTSSPLASHHSGTNRSVAKSHHSSQSQVVSRRRQGYKGKNKTYFKQRQRESDQMIQKLLDLVKEVHQNQK
ncbi:hypothetical protein O181_017071 [Austropuccinia psidii MF-1]|uniref:Uncharacterized protein n=1 Tax=Austropuccinia psidii MF-1 TaxID=1389203 RepID=A0A9Q3GRN0_9BASI|nr:hypothetical protein [Austropuccinia psidii MF-1]